VIRARANQVDYDIPPLRWYWLALVGFLPQYLIFYSPLRGRISDEIVGVALIISQILLLGFALVNMNQPGFWLLGFGLLLNLTVILANGGFMPISPDTVHRLLPEIAVDTLILGERFGTGKDIILPVAATRLYFLSDQFLLPTWSPYQVAFSIGDLVLAIGMIVFFWKIGDKKALEQELP
jgi:hypothetical protein